MSESRTTEDLLALGRVRALAATLDLDPDALGDGAPLPLGWHWIFFHDAARRSDLGPDGHERAGGFLPSLGLPRRMWAGGRLRFHRPLRVGEPARRVSTVGSVERKEGRSGRLAFVTVRHVLHGADGSVAVEEEQDLVYLEARKPAGGASAAEGSRSAGAAGEPADWRESFVADEVTLFRFSALTFNGHRIHYDRQYATEVEGYPDLVVHGPLLALLLLGAGLRRVDAGTGASFEYRAAQPLFCNEEIVLAGGAGVPDAPLAMVLRAEHRDRGVAMRATLALGGRG